MIDWLIVKYLYRRIAGARTTVTQTMTLSGEIDPVTGRIKTEYGHIDPETGLTMLLCIIFFNQQLILQSNVKTCETLEFPMEKLFKIIAIGVDTAIRVPNYPPLTFEDFQPSHFRNHFYKKCKEFFEFVWVFTELWTFVLGFDRNVCIGLRIFAGTCLLYNSQCQHLCFIVQPLDCRGMFV